MYGVSKINIEPSLMMISVQDVEFKGNSLARYLQIFADNGVVVDMISQSAPHGTTIDFSFTAAGSDLPLVMKAISAANLDEDPVFSAEVLGKGCAIEPDKGEIYAPADGVILKIAESSHAVSLRCDSGVDLLIHVGMDTVERHGAGFAPQVRAGEHVHSGQLLLKCDLQKIRADGYPLTTPVVVTNSDAFSDVTVVASGNVTEGQNILLLR